MTGLLIFLYVCKLELFEFIGRMFFTYRHLTLESAAISERASNRLFSGIFCTFLSRMNANCYISCLVILLVITSVAVYKFFKVTEIFHPLFLIIQRVRRCLDVPLAVCRATSCLPRLQTYIAS